MKDKNVGFENIIFDVDGVLLDSMPIWEDSANRYLEEVWGIAAYPELDSECASMSLLEAGEYIKEQYPQITISAEALASGVAEFIRGQYVVAPAKPYMVETVKTLYEKGYHLYLATASERENVQGALTNLGVWECFEEIYTCTEIGYSKSYTEYFEAVADEIGEETEALLMVEDSLHSMVTAKEAGLTVAGVYEESSAQNEEKIREVCDAYFDSLEELIGWIEA